MESVLGLSMTSTGICWVLLGTGADATIVDHDRIGVCSEAADGDISWHQAAVRGAQAIAGASGHEIRSVALTWTDDVGTKASLLAEHLPELGFGDIKTVRPAAASAAGRSRAETLLLGAADDVGLALACGAVLAEPARPEPIRRRRSRFGPHLRAAAAVVIGVIALFTLGPQLAGQQQAASTGDQPAADTSVTSFQVLSVPSPASARPEPIVVRPVTVAPASPDVAQAPTSPVAPESSDDDTVVAVPVAATGDTAEQPTAVPPAPNPVVPAQVPMGDVLSPLLSALP